MKNEVLDTQQIQNRIFTIRDKQVMIDSDLALLYNVEVKRLNEQVKRNIERFPDKFRFQLTKEELKEYENSLRSQNATLGKDNKVLRLQNETSKEKRGGRRYLPYAFTEQGVAMLSAVLRSETAIKVSIQIIDAFVEMRKFISQNANLFQRVNNIEQKQIASDVKQIETDTKIDAILDAIEEKEIKPKQGIFFEGQIFDAYKFVSDLFRSAKTSILIIDNYVDDTVLTHLTKKKKTVKVSIYTKNLSEQLKLDAEKFNSQYKNVTLEKFNKSHDRFIIIDDKDIYHFGASLKDLGKKWFAFSKFGKGALTILEKLEK